MSSKTTLPTATGVPRARVQDISQLLEQDGALWSIAREQASSGQRVLIATNVTGFQHASLVESLLAIALTLRGAEVHLLACDSALPACLKVEWNSVEGPGALTTDGIATTVCPGCRDVGDAHFNPLGLTQHYFSNYLSEQNRQQANEACVRLDRKALSTLVNARGDKVGMQGLAGALRYYAKGELPDGEEATNVLRRFVVAALLTGSVYDNLLAKEKYDVAVFHHGIYVPQGPAGDALRRHGVRVVNWNPSYRSSTFIFSHGNSYHYTLIDEPTSAWEEMGWSDTHEKEILDYLQSRSGATRDWIWFHEITNAEFDHAVIARELGLDTEKPIIGMLSNVAWDAQLHYPANAFENIFDWVFKTFDYFAGRPDMQLLLRIHPAEIRGTARSRQPLLDMITARYPKLPSNIFIIPPESAISTYAAMDLCKSVIVYGTKMGVELTATGKPVIVAGEAWVRGKGLTYDAKDAAHYTTILDKLPDLPAMDDKQIRRARQYAYHFFFRRMLHLPFIVPAESKIYALDINEVKALDTGNYPGLDVVCDGILKARPFIYEAERLGLQA